jgi:hypothetical protein
MRSSKNADTEQRTIKSCTRTIWHYKITYMGCRQATMVYSLAKYKFDHKGRERIVNQHVFTYTTPTQIGFRPGEAGFLYISQVGEEWLLDKPAGEQ